MKPTRQIEPRPCEHCGGCEHCGKPLPRGGGRHECVVAQALAGPVVPYEVFLLLCAALVLVIAAAQWLVSH